MFAIRELARCSTLHPDADDPLSLSVGASFAAAAAKRNDNIVADIPDSCYQQFGITYQEEGGILGSNDLLNIFAPRAGLDLKETAGWIAVSPRDWSEAEGLRVNRVALGKPSKRERTMAPCAGLLACCFCPLLH